MDRIKMYTSDGSIACKDLQIALTRDGLISEFEAKKVTNFLEIRGKVNVPRFEEMLNISYTLQTESSSALQKFVNLFLHRGEVVANKMIQLDHNKDGQLNIEGFKASLLYAEFGFTQASEVEEVFHILQRQGYFYYRDYINEHNPNLRHLFFQRSITP